MKKIEHETWTEYGWEVGDLVRLKKDEPSRLRWLDPAKAGEFGVVTDIRDGYFVGVSLHGFSRPEDSIGGGVRISRFDLVPWEREPRDEPALRERVLELVKVLAWQTQAKPRQAEAGRVCLRGRQVSLMGGDRSFYVNKAVLADALPYLGDGRGSPDRLDAMRFDVNAAGHALLDAAGSRRTVGLAGGGGLFELAWDRTGKFRVKDLLTDREHEIGGAEGLRLLEENRRQVGLITDGRMPDIVREAIPYPRALRGQRDMGVVETSPDAVELRRGDDVSAIEGGAAKLLRRACKRVRDLSRWIDAHPEIIPGPADSPAPSI